MKGLWVMPGRHGMLKVLRRFLACVLLCGLPPGVAWAKPLDVVYAEAAPGVVLVLAADTNDAGAAQAGFVVSPEGKILTGARGVLNAKTQTARAHIYVYIKPPQLVNEPERNLVNRYAAQVIAFSPTTALDLALLQLDDAPAHLTALTLGDANALQMGTTALVLGHPESAGLWAGQRVGLVCRVDNVDHVAGRHVLLLDRGLSFGQWGAPVLDAESHVVGLVAQPQWPAKTSGAQRRAASEPIGTGGRALTSGVLVGWLAQSNMALAAPDSPPADDPASASDNPTPQPSTVTVAGPPPNAELARRLATQAAEGSTIPTVVGPQSLSAESSPVAGQAPPAFFVTDRHPYSLLQILHQQMQPWGGARRPVSGAASHAKVPLGTSGETP